MGGNDGWQEQLGSSSDDEPHRRDRRARAVALRQSSQRSREGQIRDLPEQFLLLPRLRGAASQAVREARGRGRAGVRHRHPGRQHPDQRLRGVRRLRHRAWRRRHQQGPGRQAAGGHADAAAVQRDRAQRGADAQCRQALSADARRSQGAQDRHQHSGRLDRASCCARPVSIRRKT